MRSSSLPRSIEHEESDPGLGSGCSGACDRFEQRPVQIM